jgi:hypothetical protein
MKKNWLAFTIGVFLLLISCTLIFIGMNKHLVDKKVYYSIGTIVDFKGDILKETDEDKKLSLKFNDLVYSNHRYTLGDDSYIEIEINGQSLNILGPAEFTFNVVDAQARVVFINFSEFTEVLPKNFESKNVNLTYRGWMIQSFFDPVRDFEESEKRTLEGLTDVGTEPDPEEVGEPQPIPEEEKSSYLEEIISIKRPLLKKCYENYLLDNPMATGELVVEFTLNTNGKVSSAKVKDSSFFRSEGFKLCIVNVFKQIRSRPFSGDHIQVTYPIEFM